MWLSTLFFSNFLLEEFTRTLPAVRYGEHMPKKKDVAQKTVELVGAALGIKKMRGESLLGSPELRRQLREAKRAERSRAK